MDADKVGSFITNSLMLRRSLAFLADILLLFVVLAPLGFLIQQLLGIKPTNGSGVAVTLLWNFSLPAWSYFTLSDCSDRGSTPGKRLLGIRLRSRSHQGISFGRALLRTAVKLLPWELAHIAAFALSADLSQFSASQSIGIGLANVLWLTYLLVAVITKGKRSIHDFVAGTEVQQNGGLNHA